MAKPPRAGYGPLKRPNHLLALGIITFISVLLCWLAIGDKLDLMDIYLGAEEEDGKHAFATILLPPLNSSSDAHEVDQYLTSTRMLNYQLRHSKTTRSRREVPFLVIVTPDIVPWKRKLLEREGSTVIFAERISLGTEWIEPMAERWKDVMLKLRLFELTDYDKILFLDADTYLLKPRTESSETPPLGLPKPESLRRKFDLTKLLFLNSTSLLHCPRYYTRHTPGHRIRGLVSMRVSSFYNPPRPSSNTTLLSSRSKIGSIVHTQSRTC